MPGLMPRYLFLRCCQSGYMHAWLPNHVTTSVCAANGYECNFLLENIWMQ